MFTTAPIPESVFAPELHLVRTEVHNSIVLNCPGSESGRHFPQCDNAVTAIFECHKKLVALGDKALAGT